MADKRPKKYLVKGDQMICPRCKAYHNILAYVPDMVIEEYAHEVVPIIKCPSCRWRFAPASEVAHG